MDCCDNCGDSGKWCITCGGWLDPNAWWCCGNKTNQVEDENDENKATNKLVQNKPNGISAPKSDNMQRFTNLRY